MLALALGSNACTPCLADSLLENSDDPNASPPETQFTAKNQAESELTKVLFFNRPDRLLTHQKPTITRYHSVIEAIELAVLLDLGGMWQSNESSDHSLRAI